MTARTWLITGVSSGFGRELTRQLLTCGDRVIGTVRDTSKIAGLTDRYPDTFIPEMLEMTDSAAVRMSSYRLVRAGQQNTRSCQLYLRRPAPRQPQPLTRSERSALTFGREISKLALTARSQLNRVYHREYFILCDKVLLSRKAVRWLLAERRRKR